MSKRDLFVNIYCCIWGAIGMIGTTIAWAKGNATTFALWFDMAFLLVTATWVLIPPVRRFVENKIIEKLP